MKSPTRLVLVTGHVFGVRAFEGIFSSQAYLDGEIEVPLMIGLERSYSTSTVGYRSISGLANDQNVRYLFTADGRLTSLERAIRGCDPVYILIIGWSRLVAAEILAIPRETHRHTHGAGSVGCIGMHPTKLPSGRGRAPIPWTLIKRLSRTALSVLFLEEAADAGSIIAQYDLDLRQRETAASLFYRMADLHFAAGFDLAQHLAKRAVPSKRQEPSDATVWPRRRPSDGEIHDTMTYSEIEALVRALLGPYPRAFINVQDNRYEICKVEPVITPEKYGEQGAHLIGPNRVRLRSADCVVDLLVVGG